MPELHVPFQSGANEQIDAKVLPQGRLLRAQNVRLRKDGRIAPRYAFATWVSTTGVIALVTVDSQTQVAISGRVDPNTPPVVTKIRRGVVATSGDNAYPSGVSEIGVPKLIPIEQSSSKGSVIATDQIAVGGYLFIANVLKSSSTGYLTLIYMIDPTTMAVVVTYGLPGGAWQVRLATAKGISSEPYVMAFYTKYGADDDIYCYRIRPDTKAHADLGALITGDSAYVDRFDACSINTGNAAVAYSDGAVSGNLTIKTVSFAGTVVPFATFAGPVNPCVSAACVLNGAALEIVIAYSYDHTSLDGGVYYRRFSIIGAPIGGEVTVDVDSTGDRTFHAIALALDYQNVWTLAYDFYDKISTNFHVGVFSFGASVPTMIYGMGLASKPFRAGNGTYVWAIDQNSFGFGTYYMVSAVPYYYDNNLFRFEAILGQTRAPLITWTATFYPLGSGGAAINAIDPTPGLSAVAACLPMRLNTQYAAEVALIESGVLSGAEKHCQCKINGQTIVSGARLTEWDGDGLVESGLMSGPSILAATKKTGYTSTLATGEYDYHAVFEWYDPQGRRHLSPPSLAKHCSFTSGGATDYVELVITDLPTSAKGTVGIRVYRTQNGGTNPQLVNTTSTINCLGGVYSVFRDVYSDAQIAKNEAIYSVPGSTLPNDPPPAARYVAAGNDRVLLGGLERPAEVQFSKLVVTGEPVTWAADAPQYRAAVDADVTGVAYLDGQAVIFTRDSLFIVVGLGPEDNGSGYFQAPQKLPSEVGCISHQSIVLVPQGLLFQARSDRIYLLPRGGNSPVWASQQIRDTLAAYPLIYSSVMVPDENVAVFACLNTTGTAGVMIVYDTRTGEWTVDTTVTYARSLGIYDGRIVFANTAGTLRAETPAAWVEATAITATLETGDVRPFGILGDGRTRKAVLLGEYRSQCTVTVSCSYDSGQSYGDTHTWKLVGPGYGTAGYVAGDPVSLEFGLKYVRGVSYRFKIEVTPIVFSTTTIQAFTVPNVGVGVVVHTNAYAGLVNGEIVWITDGTHSGYFSLNETPGSAAFAVKNITGTPSAVMAQGATVSTVLGEGLQLNAISFETFQAQGLPRLRAAARA